MIHNKNYMTERALAGIMWKRLCRLFREKELPEVFSTESDIDMVLPAFLKCSAICIILHALPVISWMPVNLKQCERMKTS